MLPIANNKTIALLVLMFSCCSGSNLPPYIKQCKLSDPNLKSCTIESAQNALPNLRKGDKMLKIPNVIPLEVSLIKIDMGEDLKINFTEIVAQHIFESTKIDDLEFNPDKGIFKLHLLDDGFTATLTYDMNMKLLGLPIIGNGKTFVNITQMEIGYEASLKTYKKSGQDYLQIEKSSGTIKLGPSHFNFENLFNGDERLGAATNKLINENWRDFIKVLEPAAKDIFLGLIEQYLKGIFENIPKNGLFLP